MCKQGKNETTWQLNNLTTLTHRSIDVLQFSIAQCNNILTNKIHDKIIVRKYAILVNIAIFWLSGHCKIYTQKMLFFTHETGEKVAKKALILRGESIDITV